MSRPAECPAHSWRGRNAGILRPTLCPAALRRLGWLTPTEGGISLAKRARAHVAGDGGGDARALRRAQRDGCRDHLGPDHRQADQERLHHRSRRQEQVADTARFPRFGARPARPARSHRSCRRTGCSGSGRRERSSRLGSRICPDQMPTERSTRRTRKNVADANVTHPASRGLLLRRVPAVRGRTAVQPSAPDDYGPGEAVLGEPDVPRCPALRPLRGTNAERFGLRQQQLRPLCSRTIGVLHHLQLAETSQRVGSRNGPARLPLWQDPRPWTGVESQRFRPWLISPKRSSTSLRPR